MSRVPVPQGVRPTQDRVREALFSIVGQDLSDTRVLDAFGGTGLVAIEAWSRGAAVTVIERSRVVGGQLHKRGAELGVVWTLRIGDALGLVRDLGPFDGIFADPPYDVDPGPVLEALAPHARSWLVFETDKGAVLPQNAGPLVLDRQRTYGRAVLWVYRPPLLP